MQLIKMILMSMPFMFWAKPKPVKNGQDPFAICYGKVSAESIDGFSIAILESGHYSAKEVSVLKTVNSNLIAYLSLTEVNVNSSLFKQLKPFCYQKTENWDSYTINIDSKEAQDIIIDYAKHILAKGFDGLFLDNLDNTNQWGKLAHQKQSMETLIYRLKEEIGDRILIQNGGLHLDDKIQKLTDYLLVESIATEYDFSQKQYRIRPYKSFQERKRLVTTTQKDYYKKLLIVEYANNQDHKNVIHKRIDDLKGGLFITTIDLQKIPKQ